MILIMRLFAVATLTCSGFGAYAQTTLFSQVSSTPPIVNLVPGDVVPSGLSLDYVHQPQYTATLSNDVTWDVGDISGLHYTPASGITQKGPTDTFGTAAAQVGPNEIGVSIDGTSLGSFADGYTIPIEPVWQAGSSIYPFQSGGTFQVSFDLRVPYSHTPTNGSNLASSGDIGLYLFFHDESTNQTFGLGAEVFDSRGSAVEGVGAFSDPGTNSHILVAPIDDGVHFNQVIGSETYQPIPFDDLRHFVAQVDTSTMVSDIEAYNQITATTTPLSTDPNNYTIASVVMDGEVAFFGTDALFGYSLSNFTGSILPATQGSVRPRYDRGRAIVATQKLATDFKKWQLLRFATK